MSYETIEEVDQTLANSEATEDELRDLFLSHREHFGSSDCAVCQAFEENRDDNYNNTRTIFDGVLSHSQCSSELIREIISWYDRGVDGRNQFGDPHEGERETYRFATENDNCPISVFEEYVDTNLSSYWSYKAFEDGDDGESAREDIEMDLSILKNVAGLPEHSKLRFLRQVHESEVFGCVDGDEEFENCTICLVMLD